MALLLISALPKAGLSDMQRKCGRAVDTPWLREAVPRTLGVWVAVPILHTAHRSAVSAPHPYNRHVLSRLQKSNDLKSKHFKNKKTYFSNHFFPGMTH